MREAWTAEAVRTVPAERRAAAGDADELFAYARPPTKRERLEKGERRAEQHQGWADAPKEKRRRALSGVSPHTIHCPPRGTELMPRLCHTVPIAPLTVVIEVSRHGSRYRGVPSLMTAASAMCWRRTC